MSFDDSVINDLGRTDNSGEDENGFEKFLSKPNTSKPFQPFGGQMPQKKFAIYEPHLDPNHPDYYGNQPVDTSPLPFPGQPSVQNPVQYEEPQPQQSYYSFDDSELDLYEQLKKKHSQISQYTRENKKSATRYGELYDDFKKKKFAPYFESLGGFGDFDNDDEYISAIDEMYKSDLKASQEEDGFFGESDAKIAAKENLKKYGSWNQRNGMRDKFLRLKAERDRRKAVADQAEAAEFALFEQLTNIPIDQREALDASLKSRTAKPRSKKATDEMLNQMQFEKPVVNMATGEISNLEKTDPRKSIPSAVNMQTGERTKSYEAQNKRLQAAMRGDIAGFTSRRQAIAKDRQLRDKGFMFSTNGQIDGRPIGMSRVDSDILDLEEMKKAGVTNYKGQPIEQAIESLGGQEKVKVAKVMQAVYAAKSNYEDVQLEYLKNSGGAKAEALREKMEAAREEVNKTIGLATQFGLDNELFEQAETTGWLSAIGNAVKRGLLMSEMSNYTPDFLTNTLDADEMQRFIEIASEIEKLPTSSTMKRVKSSKSDGFLDAMGNLLFDNPAAIPEMFVESLSSFLPSAIKWLLPTAGAGALAGTAIAPGPGTVSGAALGARASWGAASFVLEASGMALEGMQELGIDWKNPKIFAAAWTNESIRNKIQKKMVQKGTPIAVADMLTGMMAGRVMAVANHTGNAMFKGGKLLNKSQFNKTAGSVPRFTTFQKTRNAAAELGADSLMGMSGEYLGQWASKEPGEAWDWDAIAAEGIVGVGPGVLSSALEMRSRAGNYFGNAPIEITGEQITETGSMGTVTRAGYSAPYQTFNNAESMMAHLETVEGVNPETLDFTRNWVERMFAVNPEGMSKLKIAFSPRTPDANLKNRGTFEARDGHNIMYINEKEFAADPMGAVMHESGHFARIMILSDEELSSMWSGLGSDTQLEAYTQYYTKKPDATFDSLDEKTQKKIRRAFDRTPDDVLAEEWFSYQWGRVLMGYTADKNIAKPLKNFKDKVIHPILGEYAGTENLAGAKSEQGYILDQKILQFLGYENGMPDVKVPDEGGTPSNSTPQTKEQAQRKLNAMPGSPQEKSKLAKAVNAMLGADILTESPSFYTNMDRQLAVAASKDNEERDTKKKPENIKEAVKEPEDRKSKKEIAERKKTDEDDSKDQPQDPPKEESQGGKLLPKELGSAPRKPQKSDGLFLSKPNIKAAQQRIRKAKEKEAKKAEIRKRRDEIRQKKRKQVVGFNTPKDYEKPKADPKFDKPAPKLGTEEDKLNQKTPSKNNKKTSVNPKSTSRREQEIIKLDSILPKTKEEKVQIQKLSQLLLENMKKTDTEAALDKAIGAAIRDLQEDKAGSKPSISQIIAKTLNLEKLLKLSPVSFVAEIEKGMNPTASRSKVPTTQDVEDMAIEARERVEEFKELLSLRLAEIDRELKTFGNRTEAQSEIAELQSKRKLVRMYLHYVAPEEASVEWKDVPHNLMTYRRYKFVKGEKVYSPQYDKAQPVTLGMLASMKDWQFKDDASTEYPNVEYRVSRQEKDKEDTRTPQEYLWDYVNQEFKPPRVSEEDKANIKKPFYGGLTENQYRMKLEAVKASAMFTKQQDIGKEPMGSARWEVENGVKQEARRGYPSGYTTEKGANFGALIAERIRQKGLSGKDKSDGTKVYANFNLESLEPTIPDVVALMMANGRTLELLGDPSDSMKDFDLMLFIIAREEMKSKILGAQDKGGVPSDLENQFEYAEQDGDPFIKAEANATLAKTLLGVLSTKARLKFEREYLDYIVENTQLSDPTSGKKLNLELSKESLRFKSLSEENPQVALKKFADYITSIKEKGEVEVKGKLVPVPKKIQESLTESYELLRARVDNEKYLRDQLNGHTLEAIGGVSKPQEVVVSNFKVKPESSYEFRRPLSRTSENIPAKGDHGAFTAGDMYKTFDVMTAFSKGRESSELVADMRMGVSTGFEKERTNVGKSETMPARPTNMDRDEADLLSSTDISAVDIANWYLSGNPVKQMEDLQMLPSSKDNKQLPGGLGEGLLPYVFKDFITAMYENLNINDLDIRIEDTKVDKEYNWNYTDKKMMMGGELVDFNMFSDKEGMMHPEVMAALTKPVVQAVLDAEGIDVYGQFDPNSENILQRDTTKAQSFDEDNTADMPTEIDDTDSGVQVVQDEGLQNEVLNEAAQKAILDRISKDENILKDSNKIDDGTLIEILSSPRLSRDLRDALLDEVSRRNNLKEFDRVFLTKNRTLNADAGKPINDLTVIGKIIALAQKNKPVHEINRLAAQWDDDEVYFVNSIARKKSTYEGGASNADVAKKILSDLREERKSRGFPNESLGSIEEMDFNDRSIVGQAEVIDKLLKNKDFINKDIEDAELLDGFYDLADEAENAGSSIGDLIRKAKEIEKRGGYVEFTDAVKSKLKPRIETAKAKGFGPMKVREVFNKENKYKYNPVELNSFIDEEFNTTSDRTLNSDAGSVYHGTRTNFLGDLINSAGDLVLKPSSNFGGKVTGVSFTSERETAEDYRTRSKNLGPKGRDLSQGWLIDIDDGALQEATYPIMPTYEVDNEMFFKISDDIIIPKGSWGATKDGIRVTSKEEYERINTKAAKAADAKMRNKSTEDLVKLIVDADNTAEFIEYYQYDEELSYTDTEAAQKELRRRGISKDTLIRLFRKFSTAAVISPSDYAESILNDRTLNADVTLTSDVNPNLAKANLLSRIAGDSELKKNFDEWLKTKKDSDLAGSFMMSFVDQADPVKKIHRSLFDSLKDAGLDIAKGPMRALYNVLNVHGKWHQYFGKGYDTVEQARIRFIQPIKDAMLKYNIDQSRFGKYLLARAAPSRNQHLRDKVKRLREEAEELTGEAKINALSDIKDIYLNEDGSVKNSGISDQDAYNLISEYEKDSNFVKFANEALDPYYNMNKESIALLRESGMIRESVELEGITEGLSEYDRMVGAMSKIDLSSPNSEFGFKGSKIKLSDPKYSYSPMQGFEGETEAFFDGERAWDELGKGQNGSGKGWDQPKSTFLNDPAFGRKSNVKGPNPDTVFAVAINQFFDSAIRSHKNEVSQSFADMFNIMRGIAYPDQKVDIISSDPQARMAYEMLSKLPKEQKDLIKQEFDKIFEKEFKATSEKKLYTFEEVKDQGTGQIVAKRKVLSSVFKDDPLVFAYRKDGEPMFIKFKSTQEGTRMARSMKNLKYEALPTVLSKFNVVTRFMARMFTSMNPAFIIPNFFRDLGTAFIHLTEDDKKKLVKDVFKLKNLKWITQIGKAEYYISKGKDPLKEMKIEPLKRQKGQTEEQYAKAILKRGNKIEMYAYAKRSGAKIGYVRHDTVPELIRDIKKETRKNESGAKRRLKAVVSFVDAANTGVENSIRLSTFWAAIKNGYQKDEAAVMSRNVTVDFNQKGELTQAFGSLYVFFGAAVNSTHRMMTTLNRRSRAEKLKMVGGIATASFLVALYNRLMDDDEDELVPDYDTISSYKRDTNLIMPMPAGLPGFFNDKKDTGYFSIPLPLGYNLFWTMGQVVADTFTNNFGSRGGSGIVEGGSRILQSGMNAFNPIGGSSIATIGTPTLVTPIIEIWANKNFMGREIRYRDDQFGVPKPGHKQDPKSTPAHWTALSKNLNEFFGGSDVVKGSLSGAFGSKSPLMYDQDSDIKFDISGNQMKHLFYGYLGGPGQLLDTGFGGLFSLAKDQASIDNIGQVPIINRFVRATTYGTHTREMYYHLRDAVKTAESAIKDAKKISPKAYSLVNKDLKPLLSMSNQLRSFEAKKKKLRSLKTQVENSKSFTEEQKMQRVADIEEKELNMMVSVIKKAQSLGIS